MRKPKEVNYVGTQITLAEVFEYAYAEQFADPGDILITRDVTIGGESVFDGYSYKDQAKMAKRLSKFFAKYSEWIVKQKEKHDPNYSVEEK